MVADAAQPVARVAVTTYCPPVLTAGFCIEEVNPLGPVQAQLLTELLAVADSWAVAVQVTVPFTEGVTVTVPLLAVVPVTLILSK